MIRMNYKQFCNCLITLIAALIVFPINSYARPDFSVHPRTIEENINDRRQTIEVWSENFNGDERLQWALEVEAEVEDWLSAFPREGQVNPGGRQMIRVTLDGRNLEDGHYYGFLNFTSNDPTREEYTVPVAGHTLPYPRIEPSWPGEWGEWWGIDLDRAFDVMVWGESYTINLTIINRGSAELVVEDILSSNGYFEFDTTEFTLAAGRNRIIRMTFNARDIGPNNTTITSISNAWDPLELEFRVVATVVPVFRMRTPLPDTSFDEDVRTLIADLDTVFISSDRGVQYEVPSAEGLIYEIARDGEFHLRSRPNWNGESEVIVTATVEDSTLSDTFNVVVNSVPDPPEPFDMYYPFDGDTLHMEFDDTLFVWQPSVDPDADTVLYKLVIQVEGGDVFIWEDIGDTTYSTEALIEVFDWDQGGGGDFSWTVIATDGELERDAWSTFYNYLAPNAVFDRDDVLPQSHRLVEAFPNPFNGVVAIHVNLDRATNLNLAIFDMQGRMVHQIVKNRMEAGGYNFTWSPVSPGSGKYLVKATTGQEAQVLPVVLIR